MREARPHIHCITNSVAQNFTANVLLACGASASMTICAEEIAAFVSGADGVLVNLGTLDSEREAAIAEALPILRKQKKIWALDPVFVHLSPARLQAARKILRDRPPLIRCNRAEADALFERRTARENLPQLAKEFGACVILSGETDQVSDGRESLFVKNGNRQMDRITAMGCALNAVICAFGAVESDLRLAGVSASVLFGLAGEYAARHAKGPGTFAAHFLDGLAGLDEPAIVQGAKIE